MGQMALVGEGGSGRMTKQKAQASLIGRSILIVSTEDPAEQMLVLEVALDCPECGQHAFRIAGHHLRTLRRLLNEIIEANPALTGTEDDSQVVEQYGWTSNGGQNPQNN